MPARLKKSYTRRRRLSRAVAKVTAKRVTAGSRWISPSLPAAMRTM
jgi:hypothetical protein